MVSPSLGRFGVGVIGSRGATTVLLDLSALPRRPGAGRGETQKTENPRQEPRRRCDFCVCFPFVPGLHMSVIFVAIFWPPPHSSPSE